jgi:2-polyprenyl-6-methoxyphenol hydroxylase-like FAD-dependent oxidoreductase
MGVDIGAIVCSKLEKVNCSAKGYFGMLPLAHASGEPLAAVVSMLALTQQLRKIVHADERIQVVRGIVIDHIDDKEDGFECGNGQNQWFVKRVVIADGAKSPLSEKLKIAKKRHVALLESAVISVQADHWPQHEAFIRQDRQRIYGAIPGGHACGWVVVTNPVAIGCVLQSDVPSWQVVLQEVFGSRLGMIETNEAAVVWHSVLQRRPISHRAGIVVLGNAALSTPPIGAQGLNLAIQDCQDVLHLQQRYSWLHYCECWQEQLQSLCQPRHERWYASMGKLLDQLRSEGPLVRLKERLLWAWWGVDSGWQSYVKAAGLGR